MTTRKPKRWEPPASRAFRQHVALNVRRLRTARGMTRQQLARSISDGYTPSAIREIELGHLNLPLAALESLGKALQCDASEFLRPAARPGRRRQRTPVASNST